MTVFVVIAPQDYMTADVIGVYTKRKMAENAAANAKRDGMHDDCTIQVQEVPLEG